jgi:hypothetical protein
MVASDLRRVLYLYCEQRIRGIVVLSWSEVDPSFSHNPTEEVCLSEMNDGMVHNILGQAYSDAEDSYEEAEDSYEVVEDSYEVVEEFYSDSENTCQPA